MKKKFIMFMTACALGLYTQSVQADILNAPPAQVTSSHTPTVGGQVRVLDEAGQKKVVFSQPTGDIVELRGQLGSTTAGQDLVFTADGQGNYVAVLDRTAFSAEDEVFSLQISAQLANGSLHDLTAYHFEWLEEIEASPEEGEEVEENPIKEPEGETIPSSTEQSSETTRSSTTEKRSSGTEERAASSTASETATVSQSQPASIQPRTSARSATVPSLSGNITVTNVDAQTGSFDIRVTNISAPRGLDKVLVPTWTESNGQDDIAWYEASRQSDGSYSLHVDKSNHKYGIGKYNIHLYYRGTDGSMTFAGAITTNLPEVKTSGTLTVTNVNAQTGSFDIRVTNISAPRGLDKVLVPTWTEANGQDDIAWYEASRQSDGSYSLHVDKSNHKYGTGKYNIHLYYRGTDGSMTFAGATTTNLPEVKTSGTVTVSNINAQTGSFDVHITNITAPRGLDKVLVPTWTEANGQDDIAWYEASRQTDGSYSLHVDKSNHKNGTGKYNVHLYYRGTDGSMTFAGAITTNLPEVKTSGTVTVSNVNAQTGSFDIRVTNISAPRGLDKVLLPTWTEANGQDDIAWYEAHRQTDGSYSLHVDKSNHKYGTGKYNIHLYYRGTDGSMTAITGTTVTLNDLQPSGTLSVQNKDDVRGSFDIRVTNVTAPRGLDKVLLPTWTEANGQDDIAWYEASRQTDGSYSLHVDKSNHKYGTGRYNIHLYYRGTDGSMTFAGATTTNLPEVKQSGTLTVTNVNAQTGSFDVHIANVAAPRGLDKVLLPTWTEANGQDDIAWYEASRQTDGSYSLHVDKSNHKYGTGKYNIHLYYRGTDGSMTFAGATTTELAASTAKGRVTVPTVDAQQGAFTVAISDVVGSSPIKQIEVAVWSHLNNQDDVKTYLATPQADGSYTVRVDKHNHNRDGGDYQVEVFYTYADYKELIATTTVNLPFSRSYTVYIDPGHGGRDSGASYGGVHEKHLAMSVANKLKDNLLQRGLNVLMTRDGDYDVDFRTERSRMVNASNADLFVSIHFNATGAGVTATNGIETYWYKYDSNYQPKINQAKHNDPTRLAESEVLAHKVQENLIKETGAANRGVRRETFAVLRETAIPAILVELGFMDNPAELQIIKQDSYHVRLAKALAQGVMDWYGAVGGK